MRPNTEEGTYQIRKFDLPFCMQLINKLSMTPLFIEK
jgi:hypothetical protein